jgi:hypothetical protein
LNFTRQRVKKHPNVKLHCTALNAERETTKASGRVLHARRSLDNEKHVAEKTCWLKAANE